MSKSLLRSTTTVSSMTLISRILGFVRDMVFAYLFGAVGGFDAFVVAYKIPNFMRRLFAEGAFSQAFVPILSEYRQQRSAEDAKQLIDRTAGSLASVLLSVTILTEICAPLIIMIFAPGFLSDPERFDLAVSLLRITLPYLMLISLTAFSGAILNTYGMFGPPAFTPVLMNVALISAGFSAGYLFSVPVNALAWGVLLGGFLQLLFQVPFLHYKKLFPRLKFVRKDAGVQRIIRLMIPALFGVSVTQIGLLLDTVFASFLPDGSISWLYYSQQLCFFPLGVFGVALATVVLPQLSREHSKNSQDNYCAALDWALRCVFVIAIPATIGLMILAGPLIATLFKSGRFSTNDVWMARQSLLAFSIGLPSFMLVKVLASGFYSRQNIRTPVRIAVVALCVNIILDVTLIFPLAHAGLALASAIASIINAALLYYKLLSANVFSPLSGWRPYFSRLFIANSVLAVMLFWGVPSMDHWLEWGRLWRAFQLMTWVGVGVIVYTASLWLTGLRVSDFKVRVLLTE